MTVTETRLRGLLDDLVHGILQVSSPRRLILFGSAARGKMSPNSDLDVLVIMPDGAHRRHTAQKIYCHLAGLGLAKDIVVVTEGDVQEHGANPSMVIYPALQEGKELYSAAG